MSQSIADNKPYDVLVRELLTAKGSTFENPAANFFLSARGPKAAMETTTQLFMGVRMVCAQCHDHPFEKWTQNQYFEMAAFFSAIGVRPGFESGEEVVYLKRVDNHMKHPKDGRVVNPQLLVASGNLACHTLAGRGGSTAGPGRVALPRGRIPSLPGPS